jgi:UDP:flavonoid glycosyltransferase YjiC (YdhE family)
VLLTMGGIEWDWGTFRPRLPEGTVLVVPGGSPQARRLPGAVLLPFRSGFHHPDLVAASDAVVGKLGYSTFAEAWTAGVPFGFLARPSFPEGPVLAAAVEAAGAGVEVPAAALSEGDWGWLNGLLDRERLPRVRPRLGGAEEAAELLARWLGRG